jgi:hypothetical protein
MSGHDLPVTDQWQYHAVAAIILGGSFLASQPEVDAGRIGLTGISWGGYLNCIACGVDQRFRLVMPVYGCGFLNEDSAWVPAFEGMGPDKARRWLSQWDPSSYVGMSDVPILFINGTNDIAYGLDPFLKTAALAKGPVTLCIKVRMLHDHPQGWAPPELYAFADSILKDQPALVKVMKARRKDRRVFVSYELPRDGNVKVVWGELNYTADSGKWIDRRWQIEPVDLVHDKPEVRATLPDGTLSWYVNLIDSRGLVTSSAVQQVTPASRPSAEQ